MKKFKKIILTLIFTIIYFFIFSSLSNATTLKVTGDTLNIRKGPSTSTDVVAMLFKGVECELIEEDGEWYKIKYKTYTGYVNKEYVEIVGESSSKKNNNTTTTVNEENINTTVNEKDTNNITNTEQIQNESKNDTNDKEKEINQNSNNNENNDIEIVYKKLKQKSTLRILPLIYSNEIETLNKNTQIILLGETSNWSYVQTDNNCGWIRTEYLETSKTAKADKNDKTKSDTTTNLDTEKISYISETSVNMRKGAGTNYNIIKVLSLNTEVTIIGEEGTWYKVKVGSTTGYVSKEYISDKKTTTTRGNNNLRTETTNVKKNTNQKQTDVKVENVVNNSQNNKTNVKESEKSEKANKKENTTKTEVKEKNTTNKNEKKIKGTDIVAYAKKYLGYKYVYGGDGSNGTFDCSGFTMYVYKHFGISIPHGANAQYKSKKGTKIAKYSDLQVGDIVMLTDYETGVGIGHCGIYLGNDNFIHASTTCNAVEISSFKTIYAGRFYAGLRLI